MQEECPPIQASRMDHTVFIVVTLLYWTSLYVYVPILSPYLESLGASFSFAGIVLGSYGFTQIVINLPLGIASDRMRMRRPYILLGMLTAALSCFCFALTDHIGWTLVARVISGISSSTWVIFTVLYAGYFAKGQVTRAMGLISLISVIGQLIGMGASGFLAERWGWNATFWVGGIIGLIGLLLVLAIKDPPNSVEHIPIRVKDIASVMVEPTLLKVSALSIMAHSVLFITIFGFTPSQAISLGASKGELTLLVMAFMIPLAASAYSTGRFLAQRFGSSNIVLTGFILSALCTVAIPLMPSYGWLVFTQAFNGLSQGLYLPLLLGLAIQNINQEKRATAMGFYQAAYAIGMFAGPFLAGLINDVAGLQGGFYFGGVTGFIAAGLTLYWSRREARGDLSAGPILHSGDSQRHYTSR